MLFMIYSSKDGLQTSIKNKDFNKNSIFVTTIKQMYDDR